ncbi:hypothetical protein PN441_18045 [Spirulina major CS-329]|uniref:hypothetical protein n=1 Tax=Spirulina TaxID=1154 RepID=UPI0023309F32|nr:MULTISPECIES: hypothetical protein [Spirulina]MDB9496820.1 hypothetical protein [Spirulina subsalsa CS-330]MDB9504983.1 hypothetical protein [Spirulina major CS-329]
MTLQEMIQSLDDLSRPEQQSLLAVLQTKLLESNCHDTGRKEATFWQGVLNFRTALQREGLIFTDEDFADIRDRAPGREIVL